MTPRDRLTLRLLLAAIIADVAVAVVIRAAALTEVIRGRAGAEWWDYIGAVGVFTLAIFVVAGIAAWTRLMRLTRQAEQDRDELLAFASTSHEWLWHATPDMVATACSPAAGELLGYYPEEIVGRSLFDFVHPDDVATARQITETARREGTGWQDVDLRWQHRHGHVVHLQGSAVPILHTDGTVIGFRGARRAVHAGASRSDLIAARRRVEALLESRSLNVALQPIIDLNRDRWVDTEALARFPDGRGPDLWFAEAQAAGLGTELELLAIEKAIALLPTLPEEVGISINASPTMILDPRFRQTLAALGPTLQRLTVEITEHAAVSAYDEITDALMALRENGMRLAVDDTGAGYSSFAHVLRLRPDSVKLDRTLTSSIDSDAARRAFVTAIVLLALELGASVTAEGVETAAELDTLRSLGVDQAQGYHLARPTQSPATWRSWQQRTWVPDASDGPVAAQRSSAQLATRPESQAKN
jgi:PAS domain S-box-containing protein